VRRDAQNPFNVLDGHIKYGDPRETLAEWRPAGASIGRLIHPDISSRIQDGNTGMGRVICVNREAVRRNIRQGVDPRAIDARSHRRRVQARNLPNVRLRRGDALRIIPKSYIGCVLVRGIENEPCDIKIWDHTSTSHRVQTGQGGGTSGGEPKCAVVIADDPVVIVLKGNANGADRHAGD
jgi:hypothetical protein